MNTNDYQQSALRTESPVNDETKQRAAIAGHLLDHLREASHLGQRADLTKRWIFYADADSKPPKRAQEGGFHIDYFTPKELRLLHAWLGKLSEIGEMADAILAIMQGSGLPVHPWWENLKEELGDNQWYAALMADVLDTTLEEIHKKNIAKLRARYPDKFDAQRAVNRDLDKEKEALEGENQTGKP